MFPGIQSTDVVADRSSDGRYVPKELPERAFAEWRKMTELADLPPNLRHPDPEDSRAIGRVGKSGKADFFEEEIEISPAYVWFGGKSGYGGLQRFR